MSNFVTDFVKALRENALKIVTLALQRQRGVEQFVDAEVTGLTVIYNDMFRNGRQYGEKVMQRELAKLVDIVDIPFKYNKDVLATIKSKSVFNGYFDDAYKDLYTRREIYQLKSTILRGKYSGWSESELSAEIRKIINVSETRARALARTETLRLREAMTGVYYDQPKVKAKYERVWITSQDEKVRSSHVAMDGKVADPERNQFYSEDVGWITGPGDGPPSFAINCRCHTEFRERKDK